MSDFDDESVRLFWGHVTKDCWCWTGARNKSGHGHLARHKDGKYTVYPAHVFSWILKNGPVPDGKFVLHKCDNPPCVNPEHLFLGTQADNMTDKAKKGRAPKGELHFNSKLTEQSIKEIWTACKAGATHDSCAIKFGVAQSTITKIMNGKRWRHITSFLE